MEYLTRCGSNFQSRSTRTSDIRPLVLRVYPGPDNSSSGPALFYTRRAGASCTQRAGRLTKCAHVATFRKSQAVVFCDEASPAVRLLTLADAHQATFPKNPAPHRCAGRIGPRPGSSSRPGFDGHSAATSASTASASGSPGSASAGSRASARRNPAGARARTGARAG